MERQLKGTSAAVMSVTVAPGAGGDDRASAFSRIMVILRNTGHTVASNVKFELTVSRETINGRPVSPSVTYTIPESVIGYDSPPNEVVHNYPIDDGPGILDAARRYEQTVRLVWRYSYNNSFNDILEGPFCLQFVSNRSLTAPYGDWVQCDEFNRRLGIARTQNR